MNEAQIKDIGSKFDLYPSPQRRRDIHLQRRI